ncbi:MAG: hypothetical protein AB8H79_03535, partial [Myxococcota bacterium]
MGYTPPMPDYDLPLARWMSWGGDHRQVLSSQTGLTRYRTALEPRSGVPFGSCTASWPSDRAWGAMGEALESLRADPGSIEEQPSMISARLNGWAEREPDAPVALAPSGTDAIYLVSAVALASSRRVHHVVVGASELGGGTLRASRGLTFSDRSPWGPATEPGQPVEGLSDRCTAEPIYLRDEAGRRLEMDVVDTDVRERVTRACVPGTTVVIHLVAHSKTGLRAPSMDVCAALVEEFGEQVAVLVDAAQGRLAPRDIRAALDAGFMVLFTGSKFYSGPPFSAAIFLPEGRSADPGPLPEGLGQWFAQGELPAHWERARASLSNAHNPGLYLRWHGALVELETYHAVDPRERARVYHTFAGAVLEMFGPSRNIRVDMPVPPVHRLVTGLGAYPTVFGFEVVHEG